MAEKAASDQSSIYAFRRGRPFREPAVCRPLRPGKCATAAALLQSPVLPSDVERRGGQRQTRNHQCHPAQDCGNAATRADASVDHDSSRHQDQHVKQVSAV